MKTTLTILIVVLSSAFATTDAFAQQLIYMWTNNAPDDLNTAANWTNVARGANGTPIPGTSSAYIGDMMQFDGKSASEATNSKHRPTALLWAWAPTGRITPAAASAQ